MAAPKLSIEELYPIRKKVAILTRLSTKYHMFWLYEDPNNGRTSLFEYDCWCGEIEVLSLLEEFKGWQEAGILSQLDFLSARLYNSVRSYRDFIHTSILTKQVEIIKETRCITEFPTCNPTFEMPKKPTFKINEH